ncbi:MAG: bifunctional 5,10-methylenetetrahydrofolate dehydrogenase/5,10-methenyltetrahydrofolate cyclohydrolase [Oscillospiraceae bacterium]|nr:bifunctional 5,10-methylenetetrahydrofolate dehydrogenase/5,10-methenyltetrahydrofolate cyclohydrolase [Oscillospiraceae bacterium]
MAEVLKGAPVAAKINETTAERAAALREKGVTPCIAILRVGEKPDDIFYENSAVKRADALGIKAVRVTLPVDVSEDDLIEKIKELNGDGTVHGVLMFLPLPKRMDGLRVRRTLSVDKDIDGITPGSMGGLYSGNGDGFPPCTARSCIEMIDYYGIPVSGKNAVVIGRSLVIGKPVSMMLLSKNATVTVCHTKTVDLPGIVKKAELVIAAAGRAMLVKADWLREGQTVIDVGLNVGPDGKMCGDVDFEKAKDIVDKITPPVGGVGSVTTAVLLSHVVEAAERQTNK